MKVRGTKNTQVDIDENQQLEVVERYISNVFDIPKDSFLDDDGNVAFWYEQNMGSHSDAEKKIVRKATPEDYAYFDFFSALYDILRHK